LAKYQCASAYMKVLLNLNSSNSGSIVLSHGGSMLCYANFHLICWLLKWLSWLVWFLCLWHGWRFCKNSCAFERI